MAPSIETYIQQVLDKLHLKQPCVDENKLSHMVYNIQHLFIDRKRSETGIGQMVLSGALLSTYEVKHPLKK